MEEIQKKEGKYLESISSAAGIEVKEKIIGGCILGSNTFIDWVRDFLPIKSREIPAVRHLKVYNHWYCL